MNKTWGNVRQNRGKDAVALLNYFLSHKAKLLRQKYAHIVKKYIEKWQPWSSDGQCRPEHLAGYPNFVYYVADKWAAQNPRAEAEHQVRVEAIQLLIQADDLHEKAIGQDEQVLQDIVNEIPTDEEWKTLVYRVQTNKMNVYKPGLSKAYSGTFTSLTALFEWIQQVAKEIQKSAGTGAGTVATPTIPVVTQAGAGQVRGHQPRSNLTGVTALAATVMATYNYTDDSEDDGDEDECVYIADVNMLRISTENDKSIEEIATILGIEKMSMEQVITPEEWRNGNPDVPYKNIPRTMAALRSAIWVRFRDTDLMSRLMQHV